MKWKTKYRRIIKRFALLPIEVNDLTIWLETVYIKQKLMCNFFGFYNWVDVEFVTKEDYLKYRRGEN